jgi:NADPH-dependent F420 reductase
MRIAIIGTGSVGTALARNATRAGHEVVFGSRDPAGERAAAATVAAPGTTVAGIATAVRGADVVILATPYDAATDALDAAGPLDGVIVVDCTNPIAPGLSGLSVGTTSSGAEVIAAHVPAARVVKAFNTTGAENLADPSYPGGPIVLPICGDDADAKQVVTTLARDLGFAVVDVGPLSGARYTEPFAMLWITLAVRGGLGRDFAFALVHRGDG